MATISLCMIVKDEQAVLGRCLDSVQGIVDEIIVVDTGSSDCTKEIAAAYGKVQDFEWCDDFSAARNFSFAQATLDYILWLDADDVIEPEDRKRFMQLKSELDGTADMVMLPYHTAFDAQGKAVFTYYRERLLRREAGFRWQGAVHECITPSGSVVYGEAAVSHHKEKAGERGRNLRIYQRMQERGEKLDTRGRFYYARELMTDGQYQLAAQAFETFLAMPDGWVENRIEACRNLADCLCALGRREEAKQALVRSFSMDCPRGESCCALAALAVEDGQLEQASFWYQAALHAPCHPERGGFVYQPCYGFVPCLGLCVCCDRMGQHEQAAIWNERAAMYQPDSPEVACNRRYFAQRENMVTDRMADT